MRLAKRTGILTSLWILSAVCLCADLVFAYKAGCTGDLKGGAAGDIQKALTYESLGLPFLLLGVLFASSAASMIGNFRPAFRILQGSATFIVVLILTLFAGMQIEIWGNQPCLAF